MDKTLIMTLLLSASASAQTPLALQAQTQSQPKKQEAPPALPTESSQAVWNEDVERVESDIDKLKMQLSKKELEERALRALQAGRPAEAEKAVREISKSDPFSPKTAQWTADAEFQKGNWIGALGQYNLTVGSWRDWLKTQKDPVAQEEGRRQLSVAYGNRGATRMQLRDWQGALDDFDLALKMKTPSAPVIYWQESQLLAVQLHRYADAAKALERAVALDPSVRDEARKRYADPSLLNLCQTLARAGQSTPACQ